MFINTVKDSGKKTHLSFYLSQAHLQSLNCFCAGRNIVVSIATGCDVGAYFLGPVMAVLRSFVKQY